MDREGLTRRQDWPALLDAFVRRETGRPFAWGSHDCVLFGADWVATCTGYDLAAHVRGRYRTPQGAAAVLRAHGGSLEGACDRALGPRWPSPRFAQRGDVALVPAARQGRRVWTHALGVVAAGGLVVALTNDGPARVPLRAAAHAWPVGA